MRLLAAAALLATGCAAPSVPSGRARFDTYCAACHQPEGQGLPGGGPPLAGSPWVSGSESRLIRIVLHGVRGPVTVGGVTTDREMLGFGQILSDDEIASLLTFVRARFGEAPPVNAESVKRARTPERFEYWTVAELLEIP
jgi:mono/diheme cytochrome c family protein